MTTPEHPRKEDFELLIDKKVADAKLDVTEKRFNYLLVLAGIVLGIFGVIVPLLMAIANSDKTDKAIERMETKVDVKMKDVEARFHELAGNALRKPDLDCFVDGKRLEGGVLKFYPGHQDSFIIVRNVGDAPAKNILARLYCSLDGYFGQGFYRFMPSDDKDFTKSFTLEPNQSNDYQSLDPKNQFYLGLHIDNLTPTNAPGMIKLFYEQPEPKEIHFTISILDK